MNKGVLTLGLSVLLLGGCSSTMEKKVESIINDSKKSAVKESESLSKLFFNFAEDEINSLVHSKEVKKLFPGYQPIEGNYPEDRYAMAIKNDYYGDSAKKIVYLDQGWTPGDSVWFYNTTQGSELLPYEYFVNLEQADNTKAFIDPMNVSKYRYLPQSKSTDNPDGLPVGFVKNNSSVGLTCAACHSNQINYQGTGMRIDGAPAMGHFVMMLEDLNKALLATLKDSKKFDRFAKKLGATDKEKLSHDLRATQEKIAGYNRRNYSEVDYGFARVDAVGRIYNQVLYFVGGPDNFNTPDAPVSYPFLWDTPQHDYVQWIGLTGNAAAGALGRNAGEVVGVFGDIKVKKYHSATNKLLHGYSSTVNTKNLVDMEEWIRELRSPVWPEDILPELDDAKVSQGKALYNKTCLQCHHVIDRTNPDVHVKAQMYGLKYVGTDPKEIQNALSYKGRTGILEGATRPLLKGTYGESELVAVMLTDLVEGVVFKHKKDALTAAVYAEINGNGLKDKPKEGKYPNDNPLASLAAYKARPLNGIWATAPYLHNGSVPTLYDLLLPEEKRPTKFKVGQMEFNPKKVGFVSDMSSKSPYTYDTTLTGNSNQGHNFGKNLKEEERLALLEYLKSL